MDEKSVAKEALMRNSMISVFLEWSGTTAAAAPVTQQQRQSPPYQISTRSCRPIPNHEKIWYTSCSFPMDVWMWSPDRD